MTFTPEQIKALQAPLDPRHVKPPPQGKFGEYVDAHHIIMEANRIFGFDGWSYEITLLAGCSRVEGKDRNGNPQVRVGYRCTVRATAGGVTREGAAVGSGMAKPENEADAHESAVKEAETDALKRALRSFGNTFGLALYDKTDARAVSIPVIDDADCAELISMIEASGADAKAFCKHFGIRSVKELPAEALPKAKRMLAKKLADKAKAEKPQTLADEIGDTDIPY